MSSVPASLSFITIFFLHHLIHHEQLFLAGNSDSATIAEAFQSIAFALCSGLSHRAPQHYTSYAKNAGSQSIFIIKRSFNAENYLIIYLYTCFYILWIPELQIKNFTHMCLHFDALSIGFPQSPSVTARCFVLFQQPLSRHHNRCNK